MSSLLFQPTGPPGGGIGATNLTTIVTMRGGAAVLGDVLQFDLECTDGDVSNYFPGHENSAWNNVIDPTTFAVTGQVPALFCVALEDIADNARGKVCYWGCVDAFIITSDGNTYTIGAGVAVNTDSNFTLVDVGEPMVGILSEIPSDTTPLTRTLAEVFLFNHFLSGSGV